MSTAASFAPVVAKSGEPVRLAMQRLWLTGRVLPAGARLTVQHVFRSEEPQPLEVVYAFPLPRDAALRAFRIRGEGFEAHSELRPAEDAVREYERGIAQGSLSTLARQYGDGIVNLNVGNIRPAETVMVLLELMAGVELRDTGLRFRFPFTLAPAYHPRMRSARVGDGKGEIELPPAEFGDVILPPWRADAAGLHEVGFELTVPSQPAIGEIASPSHAIRVKQGDSGPAGVSLAPDHDVPDRDLVLDVEWRAAAPHVYAGSIDGGRRAFAAVVPSTAFGSNPNTPRRMAILLDRSGSMMGAPIQQARKAIQACLAGLSAADMFALVAFDDRVESVHDALLSGTRENRAKATAFLAQVEGRGGTELLRGIEAVSGILGGAGDVLILTDGQVAGSEQILARARAAGLRLSCLGIGSASQDRLLALLARETGGVSRFVTAEERVDLAAVDLFASLGRPVAGGLKASGEIAPEAVNTVFSGTPVLLFGEAAEGSARIELTWDGGGRLSLEVPEGDAAIGQTVRLLQGARLITDWESRYSAEEAVAPVEKRKQSRVANRLRALSEAYGLASREMALVAVVARAGDRAGDLPETRVVPVGMPRGVQFDAYFAGAAGNATGSFSAAMLAAAALPPPPAPAMPSLPAQAPPARARFSLFGSLSRKATQAPQAPPAPPQTSEDVLLELVCELEPDGGMPGNQPAHRAARSVALVYALVAAGHTLREGAFRSHLARLVEFLQNAQGLSAAEQNVVGSAIRAAASGQAPKRDWLKIARQNSVSWKNVTP